MPIKLPKAFPRRKSSGNEFEEFSPPAESSFRVLERPESKSFDGGQVFKRLSNGRPLSAGNLIGDQIQVNERDGSGVNRGSGATNNSASSGGHDNSSSSARYSSTSTLPSSTDAPIEDRVVSSPLDIHNMPAPPIPESTSRVKATSRAFSFGRKKAEALSNASRPGLQQSQSDNASQQNGRGRSMTDTSFASGSTATPPRLLDAGLDLGQTDHDGFGSMFENFGKSSSQTDLGKSLTGLSLSDVQSGSSFAASRMQMSNEQARLMPTPLNVDRNRDVGPSPSSWTSHHSNEALFQGSSPMERTFSYEQETPVSRPNQGLPKSRTMPLPSSTSPPAPPAKDSPGRHNAFPSQRHGHGSNATLDADARLVMDSINASRKLDRYSGAAYSDQDDDPTVGLFSRSTTTPSPFAGQGPSRFPENRQRSPKPFSEGRGNAYAPASWKQESANTTPRAQKSTIASYDDQSLFDITPESTSKRFIPARPKMQAPTKPKTQNKIMTPAEFERYRREQEMKSTADPKKEESSDDEVDEYEDDDEIEQSKQAARQRRKQEANMSVYRQQMMKMTGEQPADLPSTQFRPEPQISASNTSNIPEINFDKATESSKASDEEDEDVPLGVLAAHGFPNKTRPPTSMSSASNIQYKSESYPPPSSSGASQAGRASGLPPFAKNLPVDPYYGASLVNSTNREALSYGHSGPLSAHGGSQPPAHPAGLVGVINEEERARAARRGSPNAQGNYGSPLPPGMMQGMPPGMAPVMSPGEQATVQMSEQMNMMMQMQMQWMQQMQQMMAGGMPPGGMPPGQMPSFMGMPGQPAQMPMPPGSVPPGQAQRPLSTGSHSAFNPQRPGQTRAMSMTGPMPSQNWHSHGPNQPSVSPSMMSGGIMGHGPDYAPSIAPSERSNVGMPSRYRPVSIAPADEHPRHRSQSRTPTFTEGTLQPGMTSTNMRQSTSADRSQSSRLSSLRPLSATPPKKASSDDDDEEGWEEMKKKRDKKRGLWRLNRKKEDPQSQYEVYDYPEDP